MISPTVFIVDDDLAFGESLSLLIQSMGFATERFTNPAKFLAAFDADRPGCIVLDVRMPHMSGLDLQEQLCLNRNCPPIIMLTGYAEVLTAVRAMRQGAIDYLQKTFSEAELWDALNGAMARDARNRLSLRRQDEVKSLFEQLTSAERDVLDRLMAGDSNKEIASYLDVSIRTVEDRRARIMRKLRAENIPQLVSTVLESKGSFGA